MAGPAIAHGGRVLKAGWLAFGSIICAPPVFAQSSDPLAPLEQSAPSGTINASPIPIPAAPVPQAVATPATVPIPRDWRGVFDAIDAGQWASAQAGIASLPRSILTPVAKAELYTAKGSPTADLASIQALIAEAPELPQANQLGLMAIRRGATTAPLVIPERATMNLGSAPVRYKARP